jgi:hypothetical protein
MAQTLTLETTVVQRETRRTADILFVPAESLRMVDIRTPVDLTETLALRPGVPVSTTDEIQDLLFASLAGRVYSFDEYSLERWRPQRLARRGFADAVFAEQLATNDLVPISSSPIRGASLTTLVAQGSAWTISGADMVFHSPLQGLGLLVLSEVGLTVAAVSRAGRETLIVAVKYRLRQRLGNTSRLGAPRGSSLRHVGWLCPQPVAWSDAQALWPQPSARPVEDLDA